MTEICFLDNSNIDKIAYMEQKSLNSKNSFTKIVYLSGFASDLYGTKATYLADFCKKHDLSFLRFDYSGTGESGGDFFDGTISKWTYESAMILEYLCEKQNIIFIASSMGAWIALKLLKDYPQFSDFIKAMIFIAPAPDFTPELQDFFHKDNNHKQSLIQNGYAKLTCPIKGYESIVTQKLLDDGNQNLVMSDLPVFAGKIHILQGMQDKEVDYRKTIKLMENFPRETMVLELFKQADHGVSRPQDLERLGQILLETVALFIEN